LTSALKSDGPMRHFPEAASLDDAYAAQRRLVRLGIEGEGIGGFKGGVITAAAQQTLGVDRPLTGVLPRSGRLNAADKPVIDVAAAPDTMVETEIGYVIGVDISYEVLNDKQARESVQGIVPVIELPVSYVRRLGTATAKDLVATNLGSARYIVGAARNPADVNADVLAPRLQRGGQTLHEANVDTIKGGQWANLRQLLNQITAQGHTVRAGAVVISGAVGAAHPAEAGQYRADFGELGTIEFELRK
jgi:2-keto-4-pentenoate hydratase